MHSLLTASKVLLGVMKPNERAVGEVAKLRQLLRAMVWFSLRGRVGAKGMVRVGTRVRVRVRAKVEVRVGF